MPGDGWREFVMYRAAPRADNATVTFALTGVGEAWIDNVSIQTIRPGGAPVADAQREAIRGFTIPNRR